MSFLAKLADGQEVIVTPDEEDKNLTVITEAGATATVSRVDDEFASEHTTGATNQFTVAASTRTVTAIDWPHYLVSVAGGSCRVASV